MNLNLDVELKEREKEIETDFQLYTHHRVSYMFSYPDCDIK